MVASPREEQIKFGIQFLAIKVDMQKIAIPAEAGTGVRCDPEK